MEEAKTKNATERAKELMKTPIAELPGLARAYLEEMRDNYGRRKDIMLKAFAHYAQIEEGLRNDDPALYANKFARRRFKKVKTLFLEGF